MLNRWRTVLVVLVLMLVVDSSLFYRYHRSLQADASSPRIKPVAATALASAPEPPTPKLAGVTWVTLRVTDAPSWLRIRSDGTIVYEQIAPPGYSQTFEARDSLRVWTGNAGAVEVEVDGRDLGALGADGEVLTRKLVADPE